MTHRKIKTQMKYFFTKSQKNGYRVGKEMSRNGLKRPFILSNSFPIRVYFESVPSCLKNEAPLLTRRLFETQMHQTI